MVEETHTLGSCGLGVTCLAVYMEEKWETLSVVHISNFQGNARTTNTEK